MTSILSAASRRLAILAGTAAALAVGLVSGAQAQDKRILSIGTGPTGGVYYPMGGGLANVLSKNVPGWQATAEVTAGSVANLQLLAGKKAEIAFSMADAGLDAMKGQDKFKDKPVPVRTLMVLYPNIMHIVTIEGTGINSVKDLKGKRVSTGAPASATEVMAFRTLDALGIDKDKDIKRERLTPQDSANAMKDKKLDAFFWVGGLPTSSVTDLAATPGTKLKLIDHAEAVEAMNKVYGPLYSKAKIPAKTYPGQDKDSEVASVWNLLVAREDLPADAAYTIVKTIFDKKADLVAVHKEAENFKLETQKQANSPLPFHAGAVKYFAEKGVKLN